MHAIGLCVSCEHTLNIIKIKEKAVQIKITLPERQEK